MNGLKNLDINAVKRPAVWIPIVVVIVLALLWWFLWMAPEGNKLSSVNAQVVQEQAQYQSDLSTLAVVKHEQAIVRANAAYLTRFAAAVPSVPDQAVLTTQVYDLAQKSGVKLPSFSDNTASPGPANGVGLVPVTITITGAHVNCLRFLDGLYTMPRLITVSSFTPSPQSAGSGATGSGPALSVLAQTDRNPYQFTITGTAYYYAGAVPATTPSTT